MRLYTKSHLLFTSAKCSASLLHTAWFSFPHPHHITIIKTVIIIIITITSARRSASLFQASCCASPPGPANLLTRNLSSWADSSIDRCQMNRLRHRSFFVKWADSGIDRCRMSRDNRWYRYDCEFVTLASSVRLGFHYQNWCYAGFLVGGVDKIGFGRYG